MAPFAKVEDILKPSDNIDTEVEIEAATQETSELPYPALAFLQKSFWRELWWEFSLDELGAGLLVLITYLLIFVPVFHIYLFICDMQLYLDLQSPYSGSLYTIFMLAVFLSVSAFAVKGGIDLLRKREWAVIQQAARVLWLAGPLAILALQWFIPSLVFGHLTEVLKTASGGGYFLAALVAAIAWTFYLLKSERIREVYDAPFDDVLPAPVIKTSLQLLAAEAEAIIGSKGAFFVVLVFVTLILFILENPSQAPTRPSVKVSPQPRAVAQGIKPKQIDQPQRSQAAEAIVVLPELRIGDTFILESIDKEHPENSHKTRRTVVSVAANSFDLAVVKLNSKTGKTRLLTFDNAWNLVAARNPDHSGYVYTPPLQYFEFPLIPGKTWQRFSTETDIRTGTRREHKLIGKVGDWEEITVPAGTFRALKVSLETVLYNPITRQKTFGTDVSWYCPEVRRSVKSETSLTNVEGKVEYSGLQLLDYTLSKR